MPLYLSSIVRTELTSLCEESHKEEKAYIMGIVHSHEDESKLAFLKNSVIYATSKFPIMHLICSLFVPYFLLGIIAVPREIENIAYANFLGKNKAHYGKCGSGVYKERRFFTLHPPFSHLP